MSDSGQYESAISRLAEDFDEKAREHHQNAEDADLDPLEAEQHAWGDALDWAASRLRQEVLESDGK